MIIKCLDHGFVKLRNIAGPTRRLYNNDKTERLFDADDIDVAQAARMSIDALDSERPYADDIKLAKYLFKHAHTSPFEMIEVWIEVMVPIFVDRQMVRHRTWSRNESSGRYIVLPNKYYIPEVVGKRSKIKKQGQDSGLLITTQEWFKEALRDQCERSYFLYETALASDVAPEHARMILHLNHYVHWLGKVDLNNLFKFLTLRLDSTAQVEARVYARAIVDLLLPHIPGLMDIFLDIKSENNLT